MNKKSIEVIAVTRKILREISQGGEENVEDQLRALIASAAVDVTRVLERAMRPNFSSILDFAKR